jgi:hypothetical protein
VDLLAAQILKTPDRLPGDDVRLRRRKTKDVVHPLLKIGCAPLFAEELKYVRLCDNDINTTQIEKIFEIGRGALRDERHHSHVVAILDDTRHLVDLTQLCPAQQTARDADGPGVLALPNSRLIRRILKRFGNGLGVNRSNDAANKQQDINTDADHQTLPSYLLR